MASPHARHLAEMRASVTEAVTFVPIAALADAIRSGDSAVADRTLSIPHCGRCPFHVARRCEAWRFAVSPRLESIALGVAESVAQGTPPPAECPLRDGAVRLEVTRG